jgi:uncharacterized SAM-binding protein YcdF (DUF218 family)
MANIPSKRVGFIKNKYLIRIAQLFGLIFVLVIIFSESLLNTAFQALVHEDPLEKTEAIVVLVGSPTGNRLQAAVKLYHQGLGDKLVFSGFQVYPETFSNTLMKKYALKLKVPEDRIITEITNEEVSTRGESIANLALLKKNQIKTFTLVTSAYHTRRSKLIYDESISLLNYDIKFRVFPAPDPLVPIQGWWKLRTGQKGVFLEFIKLTAYFFSL